MIAESLIEVKNISQSVISVREKQVLNLISKGYAIKEMASELYLSEHTIVSHKKSLAQKLDAKNCVDLIVKAIRKGFINL